MFQFLPVIVTFLSIEMVVFKVEARKVDCLIKGSKSSCRGHSNAKQLVVNQKSDALLLTFDLFFTSLCEWQEYAHAVKKHRVQEHIIRSVSNRQKKLGAQN